MNQIARYLLVIALSGAATYFISNRSAEINSLELELTHWRALSVALENELTRLRQESSQLKATSPISLDNKSKPGLNASPNLANQMKAAATEMPTSQQSTKPTPPKMLDSKSLDNLLQNGELEKALDNIRNDLEPEQRVRLISALAKLQESSVLLNSKQYNVSDPEYLRSRIDRSIRILEVNRLFEHELGIGVSQFLSSIDSSAVQDVSEK